MRVPFQVRQMLRLLSDSISRNVERLSYAQRLQTKKLVSISFPSLSKKWEIYMYVQINTIPTDVHRTGCIVSKAEDLLGLFDADFGRILVHKRE